MEALNNCYVYNASVLKDINMPISDTLDQELKKILKDKLEKLHKRTAFQLASLDPKLPARNKAWDKTQIESNLLKIEKVTPSIKLLLKRIRKNFRNIWDETNIVATYLVLGKVLNNLESATILAKQGYSYSMVELIRSGVESCDLALLLMEESQEEIVKEWFQGRIIKNEKSRKLAHKILNNERTGEKILMPIESAKKDVYEIYSHFTHNSYSTLLELIDPYKEDLDYEQTAGFHYSQHYFHLIENLAVQILLEIKNLFVKTQDLDGIKGCNSALQELDYNLHSKEEAEDLFTRYYNC
jgi:hypothetical protein